MPIPKHELFTHEEWLKHRKEAQEVARKIDEMHISITAIRSDTQHLLMLDTISNTLREMKDSLIEVISGKNVVDVETVKDMLKAQQATYHTTVASICKIFGLIIVVLVGLKLVMPHWLGN